MIVDTAIKKACEAKDLTREGILNAHRSQTTLDPGLGTPMDFTSPTGPPPALLRAQARREGARRRRWC